MNQSVPLYVVLLILTGGGAAYLLYRLWRAFDQSARRIADASAVVSAAMNRLEEALITNSARATRLEAALTPAAAELQASMAAVPKLLEAVAKVGSAQLEIMQAQRASHAERQAPPFGKPNVPIPPRDVESANQAYEVDQMVRAQGISREEAMLRMNPANAGSVWNGDQMFAGWR